MRVTPSTPVALWALAALVALAGSPALGCAAVFGLDEPTVREGDGGGGGAAATGTGATTGGATNPGAGGEGDGAGQSEASSSSGAGCDATEANLDQGDCRIFSCRGGELVDDPDDTEDPPDANPPCETTICDGGVPTPVYADEETTCGGGLLLCDGEGTCVCDVEGPATQCGVATDCAVPSCMAPGVCDPGFYSNGTTRPDGVSGDCRGLVCDGVGNASAAVDDTDRPTDQPCAAGVCTSGVPSTMVLSQGMPCLAGLTGVCDGFQPDASSCKTCIIFDGSTRANPDLGCEPHTTPFCDENADGGNGTCLECTAAGACGDADGGPVCDSGFCGCLVEMNCNSAGNGSECIGDVCGCTDANDCDESLRGETCLAGNVCGCVESSECVGNPRGIECLGTGQCGCGGDEDCPGGGGVCVIATGRCF